MNKLKWLAIGFAIATVVYSGIALIAKITTSSADAKTNAIKEAMSYEPPSGSSCTDALVPAIHVETKARYTFPSGCLAPGWEAQ